MALNLNISPLSSFGCHLVWYSYVCVIRASALRALTMHQVLHYLTRTMKRVYAPHMRRVCFVHV